MFVEFAFFGLSVQMHFVSMNTRYSDIKDALAKEDGLAVLGVFMKVTFYCKWFFSHDEGKSKLYKFNSKQFFGDGSTLDFLTGNQLLRF